MNALTQQQSRTITSALNPTNLDEAMRFAEILSKSDIIPKDYQGKPGNILIAIQWGMEVGMQPLQSLQNIAAINGRPALWGDSMLALVRQSGLLEWIQEDSKDTLATCTVKRKGSDPISRTFCLEDAKRAGLLGKQGPWTSYPKRMMQMRARAFALRDGFGDVLKGMASAEEQQDIVPEKDMGSAEVVSGTRQPSQSETIKEKMRKAKAGDTDWPERFSSVSAAIQNADSVESLKQVKKEASGLPEPFLSQAREAYKAKMSAFLTGQATAPPETAPPETVLVNTRTGEILDTQSADWISALEASADTAELEAQIATIPPDVAERMQDHIARIRAAFS